MRFRLTALAFLLLAGLKGSVPVIVTPVTSRHGMVAAGHPEATAAGLAVLEAGGSAIDAAVAVSFSLGVAEPYASGIGGKIELMYFDAATGKTFAVDGLDQAGSLVDPAAFRALPASAREAGWRSACVPGLVSALALAHDHWGKRPWSEDLQPAIALARNGFTVLPKTIQLFAERISVLRSDPEIARLYLPGGKLPVAGTKLASPDLAHTMVLIAAHGAEGFYKGPVAEAIAKASAAAKGYITLDDLAHYQAKLRTPLSADVFGYHIEAGAPPAAGSSLYLPILKALETEKWADGPLRSAANLEKMGRVWQQVEPAESASIADVPGAEAAARHLLSPEFIALVRSRAGVGEAGPVSHAPGGAAEEDSPSRSTTHYVIVDSHGNIVSATQSTSLHFGSGMIAPGTGVVMNDTMSDFATGNSRAVNFVAPNKRPRTTISPSIVFKEGKPVLAIGIPGGSRIPIAMLQVLLDYFAFHRPLAEAIGDIRLQLPPPLSTRTMPKVYDTEVSLPAVVVAGLQADGWKVVSREKPGTGSSFGGFNAIEIHPDGTLTGYSDPRRSNVSEGY